MAKLLAVGFSDAARVQIFSSSDLRLLYTPSTKEINRGDLHSIAWSTDGAYLYAAGRWQTKENDTGGRQFDVGVTEAAV